MSRPPARAHATGSEDRVIVNNGRGQTRIIGDPFATVDRDGQQVTQLNQYGHSVNIHGETSGALMSKQQQQQMQSKEAAGMLLDALEKYGPAPGARAMLDWERSAAVHAAETGVYVSWRSPKGQDCTRVGPHSMCFCGCSYSQHGGPANDGWKKNKMRCDSCSSCMNFSFIPQRPEECGEWWLPRRKEFDVREYKAKCKCKHDHTQHDAKGSMHKCKLCGCGAWNSAFLCVVCDCHSEAHETVWETAQERISSNRPVGEEYLPFAEAPEIGKLVFDRQRTVEKRPGEKPTASVTTSAARPRVAAPGLKEVRKASASAVAGILKPATASSSPSASPSVASKAKSRSTNANGLANHPASSSSAASLTRQMAAHHLDDDPADSYDNDPFAVHDSGSTRTRNAAPPARSTAAPQRAVGPSTSSSATGRSPSSRPVASSTASRSVPSSAAVNARAERQAFEAQLASNVKQASSSFKPVFD